MPSADKNFGSVVSEARRKVDCAVLLLYEIAVLGEVSSLVHHFLAGEIEEARIEGSLECAVRPLTKVAVLASTSILAQSGSVAALPPPGT